MSNDDNTFREELLRQDSLGGPELARHRERLSRAIRRRLWIEKIGTGGLYVLLTAGASVAAIACSQTMETIAGLGWCLVSAHFLQWFLVYLVRRNYRIVTRLPWGDATGRSKTRKDDEPLMTIVALGVFLLSTAFLIGVFFLREPSKAVHMSVYILWAPMFFQFAYLFKAMSRVGGLWAENEQESMKKPPPGS